VAQGVALGDWSRKTLKHNSTQNDLPEEFLYIRQDSLELFYEAITPLKTRLSSASKKKYQ
jgi:hypothetical protein